MSNFSNRSVIHKRFSNFVEWIAPEDATRDTIKFQSDEIRKRICNKLENDGYIVAETPFSGSFKKKTGLRRYMRGETAVEGQDVDIAFILESKRSDGNEVGMMVEKMAQYAQESYPNTTIKTTKSSAKLEFVGTKLSYDLVPLIKTSDSNIQILIRTDGEERQTSVIKHAEFVRERNKSSNEMPGRVKYNECVRLVKWWRIHRQIDSRNFGNGGDDNQVSSFLLDLMCAEAFRERGVEPTYAVTLAGWFGHLANVLNKRTPIVFEDFGTNGNDIKRVGALWIVLDPVNENNNVAKDLTSFEIDELQEWFEFARDTIAVAIARDEENEHDQSLDSLAELFGNSFANNCQ